MGRVQKIWYIRLLYKMTSAAFGQGKEQGVERGLESTNPISHSNFQLNLFFFDSLLSFCIGVVLSVSLFHKTSTLVIIIIIRIIWKGAVCKPALCVYIFGLGGGYKKETTIKNTTLDRPFKISDRKYPQESSPFSKVIIVAMST